MMQNYTLKQVRKPLLKNLQSKIMDCRRKHTNPKSTIDEFEKSLEEQDEEFINELRSALCFCHTLKNKICHECRIINKITGEK